MFCIKCGNQLEDTNAFCTHCGAPVEDESDTVLQASNAASASSPSQRSVQQIPREPEQKSLQAIKQETRLLISNDTGPSLSFDLNNFGKTQILIGRSKTCDIVLNKPTISNRHGIIEVLNGDFFYSDIGSMNGSLIDGQKLDVGTSVSLCNDLTIVLGGAQGVELNFSTLSFEKASAASSSLQNNAAEEAVVSKGVPSVVNNSAPAKLLSKAEIPPTQRLADGSPLGFMAIQVRPKQDKSFPGVFASTTANSLDSEPSDGERHAYVFDDISIKRNGEELFSTGVDDIHGELIITDSRVAVVCDEFKKGDGGWIGWGSLPMIAIAAAANAAADRKVQKEIAGEILVGHIRHEWLTSVSAACMRVIIKVQMLLLAYKDSEGNTWLVSMTINKKMNLTEIYNRILKCAYSRKQELLSGLSVEALLMLNSPPCIQNLSAGTQFQAEEDSLPSVAAPLVL